MSANLIPEPSQEQQRILDKLKDSNLVVDSVAGSGKTTTNLHVATTYPELNILLLTYNAKLKLETREKASRLKLRNLEVHSYHSFVVKHYDPTSFTDARLREFLKEKLAPKAPFKYELIILDEAQDITPLYFELVCKLYQDNQHRGARLCVVGDRFQSIYDFQQADERMIQFAPQIFNFNGLKWEKHKLSESFRVSSNTALFINNCLLGQERILSKKSIQGYPRYIVCDCFGEKMGTGDRPHREVEYYLKQGYDYEDFFILAPSIRSQNSPVRQLANKLSDAKLPVFVPFSDEERLDEDVVRGKIVFSTFHQVKGLERKVVMIFNFDNSYFQFYKKGSNPTVCPNEIYVAVTRSLERLSVFHHYQNDFLPFLDRSLLSLHCQVEHHCRLKVKPSFRSKNIDTPVTDLIRHLPSAVLAESQDYFLTTSLRESSQLLNIPTKVKQKFGYENVSDITGTAIPAYFEHRLKKTMSIYQPSVISYQKDPEETVTCLLDFGSPERVDKRPSYSLKRLEQLNLESITPEQLLEIATHWNAYTSGYVFKVNQIDRYDWLSQKGLDACVKRMSSLNITSKARFERRMELENCAELSNRKLIGYIDCVDQENIYEFKCVKQVEPEHYLQLALYAYINESNSQGVSNQRYFLYNVLTDQLDEVLFDYGRLKELVAFLIRYKYYSSGRKTDRQLIESLLALREQYRLA
jgi:superfamily I DNA/RNA helicase